MKILLLDDENSLRLAIRDELSDEGHTVSDYGDPQTALALHSIEDFDCIISDIRMPNMDGFELLKLVRQSARVPVLLMTAFPDASSAVSCMKQGAFDYLLKPVNIDELILSINKIQTLKNLLEENEQLKSEISKNSGLAKIIGTSKPMLSVLDQIKNYAPSDATILIEGETGTGKEVVADAIHSISLRKNKPLIKLNCSAFSKELIESELFGHEKGAFTGAVKSKRGRFEQADGGTIFLDEVDDLSLDIQLKLLRVLENKEIEKVGGESKIKIDVRIIAATKVDLKEKVQKTEFRKDFFYRIYTLPIHLPPLRKRGTDIPLLLDNFLKTFAPGEKISFAEEALKLLKEYPWPGNVRELKHLVERLCITKSGSVISKKDIPPEYSASIKEFPQMVAMKSNSYDEAMKEFEILFLNAALKEAGGNRKQAARNLSIPYSTLRHRLDKLNLSDF